MMNNEGLESADEFFMKKALVEARRAVVSEDVPVGAVIVLKNKVIARAHNQVELLGDPTAHAEMITITEASAFLKSKWLKDCTLYVTIEPCSMCAGALVLSRIFKVVYGAGDPKTGAGGSVFNILHNEKLNHRVKVKAGVLKEECAAIIKEFFRKQRIRNN
ncbi:MAG: tRNA adenosine(34) deaminase TadA [Candidatus Omnitrophota bacterium]